MSKDYAIRKLLEHGPMTRRQIIECTRWTDPQVRSAISYCLERRYLRRAGTARIGDGKAQTLYLTVMQ